MTHSVNNNPHTAITGDLLTGKKVSKNPEITPEFKVISLLNPSYLQMTAQKYPEDGGKKEYINVSTYQVFI
ncbi:hypothetical protein [Cylindrospermopsis raciborskii]|uniref:Uncharacterized protein n=1 Tax=Cylindrospermopsis raciborskii CENA302 TaxID=1170768 RepID=A0A9Q5QYJ9_9CYAN|nr:hypothetical protein [Cylindrospermopsis raciborskii]MCZ2204820.1 hypothetical protein [Cylindrospermopsis raciborskii PAMP2011]OHY31509.1 hypothetical protein BCV64_16230 [Cylindrospermopsis raciborskii MVCC14]OPH10455.1 hypothetical protein CENA302_05885 [Cylindrospermopsis raciborskii CENA302]